MTNLLYLFNPDQDLALASGEVNYMPPASARRMAEELALLPVWFADGPCSVLAPSAYNQSFLEEMLDLFPLPASLRFVGWFPGDGVRHSGNVCFHWEYPMLRYLRWRI